MGFSIQLSEGFEWVEPDKFVIRLDLQSVILGCNLAREEGPTRVPDHAVVMQEEMIGSGERSRVERSHEASLLSALTDCRLNFGFARINPAAWQMQQMTSPQPGHSHQCDKAAPLNHGEGGRTIRAGSLIHGDPKLRDRHQSTEESAT